MDQIAGAEHPSAQTIATNDALALIKAHLATNDLPGADVIKALGLVASQCGFGIVASYDDDDDDEAPTSTLDENEADEARARALRGEIEDALIHLGRALPAEYAVIADRIGDHLRRAR